MNNTTTHKSFWARLDAIDIRSRNARNELVALESDMRAANVPSFYQIWQDLDEKQYQQCARQFV